MRNPNFARALTRAQNSGPPLHKILDPPLVVVPHICFVFTHNCMVWIYYTGICYFNHCMPLPSLEIEYNDNWRAGCKLTKLTVTIGWQCYSYQSCCIGMRLLMMFVRLQLLVVMQETLWNHVIDNHVVKFRCILHHAVTLVWVHGTNSNHS